MKVTILSETEHYALIDQPAGPVPTMTELLPILETLRSEHSLRLVYIKNQINERSVLLCEKIGVTEVK